MSKAIARDRLWRGEHDHGCRAPAGSVQQRQEVEAPPVRELQIEHEKIEVAVGERALALSARLHRDDVRPALHESGEQRHDVRVVFDVEDEGRARAPLAGPAHRREQPFRVNRFAEPVENPESVAGQLAASPLRIERDDHDRKRAGLRAALSSWMSENPS